MIRQIYESRKWVSLLAFIIQNSILIIALRYSAVYSILLSTPVISSTEVVLAEACKLLFSILICLYYDANFSLNSFKDIMMKSIVEGNGDIFKLCVPAVLYTIQNNLQYVIESGTLFLVLYQFKIISTGRFNQLNFFINAYILIHLSLRNSYVFI